MDQDSLRAASRQSVDPAELSLRALRVFIAVEEAGSITRGARRLAASASAVSQQITNLEAALGARLFDRRARPIALTPAGAVLRRHAHRILDAVGEARGELMALNLSSLPELRLALIDDFDASITPALAGHLGDLYPHCFVTASSGRSDDLTGALLRREADIVVTAEPPRDLSDFDLFALLREPFVMVAAPGLVSGPVSGREDDLAALRAAPFVHYSASMPIGRAIAAQLRRLRMTMPQRYAFDASRSVFAMVRERRGWAITTPLCLLDSDRAREELEVRPLPFAGFSRSIYLVARRAELGGLPERLATLCRDLLETRTLPAVRDLAPWCGDAFEILRD